LKGYKFNLNPNWYYNPNHNCNHNPNHNHDSPDTVSGLKVSYTLPAAVILDEKVTFTLPGFILVSATGGSLTGARAIILTGNGALYYSGIWTPLSATLTLTCILGYPKDQFIQIMIATQATSAGAQFKTPLNGIPSSQTTLKISSSALLAPVYSQLITTVTIIPKFGPSALSFLSADLSRAIGTGGSTRSIELYSGHGLNGDDIGTQFSLASAVYTISGITNDFIFLLEAYSSPIIFLGLPALYLFTPNYRPADYLSGSGTLLLTFRYHVKRGDYSPYLQIQNPSTSALKETLLLNDGTLKRTAVIPSLDASRLLPNYLTDNSISVNSSAPFIVNFTSSSRAGIFSEGEKVSVTLTLL
jgi:hypothetical protein